MKNFYYSSLCLFGLLLILSGCNCCTLPYLKCPDWDCWRRPQVFCEQAEEVCDYNCVLEEYNEMLALPPEFEKKPLTAEDFKPHIPTDDEFLLSKGDVLEIAIFEEKETYLKDATVAPDGKLYYVFFEGIDAAGRTIPEVRHDLEVVAKKYFNTPVVTIQPVVAWSQSYIIFGRVRKPGIFYLSHPLTLREVIADSEGFLPEDFEQKDRNSDVIGTADLTKSFIVRDGAKLDVNFVDLILKPDGRQNIFVRPGDYIYIAPLDIREVYVLGGVVVPSRLQYTTGMTLMRALASVGGWTAHTPYSADITGVIVIRGCLDDPLAVEVDLNDILRGECLDIMLMPGDIIYVKNKTMRFGRELVRIAVDTFIAAFGTAAGSYYSQLWFNVTGSSDVD